MALTGFDPRPPLPPRRARQLKETVAALFTLYSFHEVMTEIAHIKPGFDIHIEAIGITEKRAAKGQS